MPATYTDNGNTPNGSQLVFTYTFPAIQTEDVKVALNGVTQATTKYTVDNTSSPTKITFNNTSVDSNVQESSGAPKSGVAVKVYRETIVGKSTGDEDPKAVFAAGSSVRASDLNNNQEQALFGIHELQEQQVQTESIADGAVTLAKIKANAINGTKIADDSIVNVHVNTSAAIAGTKISPDFGSQAVATTGTLATGATTVTGNITVSGTVDGRDVAADGTKLDGIEALATADQTASEIRTLVESASDSNVFTDADHSKLNAIEASATADQTDAEIRTAVEAATDSNVFTDADHTKLNAIEASADVTDTTNVNAAGAVMNSDLDGKGELLVGDGSGDPSALAASTTNGHILTIDTTEATGMKWAANAGSGGGGGSSLTVIDESTTLTSDATKLTFIGAGVAATEPSADEITITITGDLVQDTTPQLGGALDVQAQEINSSIDGANIKLAPNGIGVVEVKGNNNPGTIQLNCENNSHGVKLKGPAHSAAASYTLTLPNDDGSANEVLKTDGSGNLSWTTNPNTQLSNAEVRTAVEAASDSNVFTDADHTKLNGVATSANNYVHPNHSGEVTSTADGATVIADNIVDEANLKVSNTPTNGQFLSAQSGNTGGLTWATIVGSITALNNQTANRLTTIGSTTTELDGEASLTFEDTTSTGLISGKQITGRGFECPATVSDDWTIAAGNNAFFPGPMTVAANKTVTVPANRTLTIV
tara:strand:- start:26 stop:2155 length:2130 start_codon:yes stop_codon:yes gene_type:complete